MVELKETPEWDPLTPMDYGSASSTDEPDIPSPHADDHTPVARGHSDPFQIVWVWLMDGRLERVRISANWRHHTAEHQVTLRECVEMALDGAWAADPRGVHEYLPEAEPEPLQISSEADFTAVLEELERAEQEASSQMREDMDNPPPPARGTVDGVTATLDMLGRVRSVEFSETWLSSAHPRAVERAIVAAAQEAVSNYHFTGGEGILAVARVLARWELLHEWLLERSQQKKGYSVDLP